MADIPPINGVRDFFREFWIESRKLWLLAAPAIFTSVCQYSLGAVTQVFSGHLGTLPLAAFSFANSVISGFSLGILVRTHHVHKPNFLSFFQNYKWFFINIRSFFLPIWKKKWFSSRLFVEFFFAHFSK